MTTENDNDRLSALTNTSGDDEAPVMQQGRYWIEAEERWSNWIDRPVHYDWSGVKHEYRYLYARPQSAAVRDEAPVAWACTVCNSPRSIDPCPKCGRAVTKPADGWEWPDTPDIHRIRTLAREVGYAIGVHGTMERDLDIIAMPWVAEAVMPMELAQHIASGLDGIVLDYQIQDKPCGRWSCNISPYGWFKMIDLSVMPPSLPQDIISLVIAVREFWDVNNDLSPESVALDRALNAFASRVPFENEPAPALHSTQEG